VNKLAVVNGLRGVAILAVIFYHSFFDAFKYGWAENRVPLPLDIFFSSGWLGVNLFFVLSGFVLYLPYATGQRDMRAAGGVRDFYRRRALRLLPLYTLVWVVSLVFVSGLALSDPEFYIAAAAFLTCLFPFHPDYFEPPGNWVMWSLGVEIWFSVLFPLLVAALHRFGWRRVFTVALLGALAVRIAGHVFAPSGPGIILNFVSDSVLGRLDEFLYGMLAAHLYVQRRALPAWCVWAGFIAIGAAMLMWAAWFRLWLPLPYTAFAINLLDVGLFCLLMQLLLGWERIASLVSARVLQLAGMMCYSIYLWHGIVRLKYGTEYDAGVIQYASYLAIVFALSALTYRYVEFGHVREWRALIPARAVVAKAAATASAILLGILSLSTDAAAGSLAFRANEPRRFDYALQRNLPAGFGKGEFTLEFFVQPDEKLPVGTTSDGVSQLTNWSESDSSPYGDDAWWYVGNFLLDGHNNAAFGEGTFSVQFHGAGRVRWLFGDGTAVDRPGKLWAVQAVPASSAPSLLDGQWHRVALVRRAGSPPQLELWVDGSRVAATQIERMVDMRRWWSTWSGYPAGQAGWFWGTEKQAAIGAMAQWEDYKGGLDDVRFWTRALAPAELGSGKAASADGLAAEMSFDDAGTDRACETRKPSECWTLVAPDASMRAKRDAPPARN
jgi:peptidoglycan/LPS O-acetylase OafA/YrhL